MTYSLDFRRKVLTVREKEGLTIAEVATRFCVGIASVVRWLNKIEPQTTRNKPATKIDRIALARDVREYPDAYQAERAQRLGVSEKGVGHALRRMNITYKKNTAASQGGRRHTARLPSKS
ncbi:MAG: IS630 transposase-related protein [Patescibacteria group bacterium]